MNRHRQEALNAIARQLYALAGTDEQKRAVDALLAVFALGGVRAQDSGGNSPPPPPPIGDDEKP